MNQCVDWGGVHRPGFPFRTLAGSDVWPGGSQRRAEQLAMAVGETAAGCAVGPLQYGTDQRTPLVPKVVVHFLWPLFPLPNTSHRRLSM